MSTRQRWHYTSLCFFDAFAQCSEEDKQRYPIGAMTKQAQMLDALGEEGWEVYEIKFDEDGRPLYFLRLTLT